MNRHFNRSLARWGFTVCAAVALVTGQPLPCLVCTALAAYSWRSARPRRRR